MIQYDFSVCNVRSGPCAVKGCSSTAYHTNMYCAGHNHSTPKVCERDQCSHRAEVMGFMNKSFKLMCMRCAYEMAIRSGQLNYTEDESESDDDLRSFGNALANTPYLA